MQALCGHCLKPADEVDLGMVVCAEHRRFAMVHRVGGCKRRWDCEADEWLPLPEWVEVDVS